MKKWLAHRLVIFSVIITIMVMSLVLVGTRAYFNDSEQSTDNSIRIVTNWYDLSWHYRKAITISNSGSALTDYQLKLTVDTETPINASKMQTDGDDIRFTTSDGDTEISNYWIETGLGTTSTIIWVKVPSIPAGSSIIYIYYGNSSATSISSGDNTFIFFDSFETYPFAKWTVTTGTATQVSTQKTDGSYSMLLNFATVYATFTNQAMLAVEYDARPAYTNQQWNIQGEDSAANQGPSVVFSTDGNLYVLKLPQSPLLQPYSADTWYSFLLDEIRVDTDTFDVYINGILRTNDAGFYSGLNGISSIRLWGSGTATNFLVDKVKIRQYASNAPTYSIGSEQ